MNPMILFAALLIVPVAAKDQAARSALALATQYARYAGDCARTVQIERSQSFPIPVKTAKGLRYRLMYYPAVSPNGNTALDKTVYAPSAVAQFDADGRDVTCHVAVELPKVGLMTPLGPQLSPKVAKMTRDEYAAQCEKLYAALERAAKAFDAGKMDFSAREAAVKFQSLFETLSEPGLKEHYRALSPDFWSWLDSLQKK